MAEMPAPLLPCLLAARARRSSSIKGKVLTGASRLVVMADLGFASACCRESTARCGTDLNATVACACTASLW